MRYSKISFVKISFKYGIVCKKIMRLCCNVCLIEMANLRNRLFRKRFEWSKIGFILLQMNIKNAII